MAPRLLRANSQKSCSRFSAVHIFAKQLQTSCALQLQNLSLSLQKKFSRAWLHSSSRDNSQNRALASARCVFLHSSNRHYFHVRYKIFVFLPKTRFLEHASDVLGLPEASRRRQEVAICGSRRIPGGFKMLPGGFRRFPGGFRRFPGGSRGFRRLSG